MVEWKSNAGAVDVCPVMDGSDCEVTLRSGETFRNRKPQDFTWEFAPPAAQPHYRAADILLYRVWAPPEGQEAGLALFSLYFGTDAGFFDWQDLTAQERDAWMALADKVTINA